MTRARRPSRRPVAAALVAMATAVVTVSTLTPSGTATAAATTASVTTGVSTAGTSSSGDQVDRTPYLGWSSWSLQAAKDDTLNPRGNYSWLTARHVLQQARVMARTLKPYGYRYVNIDAGWWMNWDWQQGYDAHGRQTPDPARFPHGIAPVADRVHRMGLKLGIYLPVGLEKGAYDEGDFPIAGARGCSTHDIVYDDLRTTNGWDSAYKIDFAKPCAQAYVDSQVSMLAGWGVDFLKLDGVGPGSNRSGPNYDNQADVAAFHRAVARAGRPMILELSWALDHAAAPTWQANADGWRVDGDVECYCSTLAGWRSVSRRFTDVLPWIDDAGPRTGWNDLDSLDVGVGAMDGLTRAERRTTATLWAIEAAPLYSGDDLTRLDAYGRSLLTNREVLAVDQQGRPARPVSTAGPQQVWWVRNADGSYTVALFNLADEAATVRASWSDLGVHRPARVRDLWAHRDRGVRRSGYATRLAPHAAVLLRVAAR